MTLRGEHKAAPPPNSWVVRHLSTFSPRWRYISLNGNRLHCSESNDAKNSITDIALADCVLQDGQEGQLVVQGEVDVLELDFRNEQIKNQWVEALRPEVRAVEERSYRSTYHSPTKTGGGLNSSTVYPTTSTPNRGTTNTSAISPPGTDSLLSSFSTTSSLRNSSPRASRGTHVSADMLTQAIKHMRLAYEESIRETQNQRQPSADRAAICAYLVDQVLYYLSRLNGDLGALGATIAEEVFGALYVQKPYHGLPKPIHEFGGNWDSIKAAAKRYNTPFWFEQSRSAQQRTGGFEDRMGEMTKEIRTLQTHLRHRDEKKAAAHDPALEDELKRMQDLLWEEKSKTGELISDNKSLELELQQLTVKYKTLESQMGTLRTSSSSNGDSKYNDLIKQLDADNQKLYDQMSDGKAQYHELSQKHEINLTQLEKAKQTARDLDMDNKKLFDQLMELKARLSEAEHGASASNVDERIMRYKTELEEHVRAIKQLDADNAKLFTQNADLKAQLSEAVQAGGGNNQKLQKYRDEINLLNQDNDKLMKTLGELKIRYSDLQAEKGGGDDGKLDQVMAVNQKMDDELTDLKQKYDDVVAKLSEPAPAAADNSEVESLKQENASLKQQDTKQKQQIQQLEGELKQKTEQSTSSGTPPEEIETMSKTIAHLQEINDNLQRDCDNLDDKKKELEEKLAAGGGGGGGDAGGSGGGANVGDLLKIATDLLAGNPAERQKLSDVQEITNNTPGPFLTMKWLNLIAAQHAACPGKVTDFNQGNAYLLNAYLCLLNVLYPEELSEEDTQETIGLEELRPKADKIRFTLDKLEVSEKLMSVNDMLEDGHKDCHVAVLSVLFSRFCDPSQTRLLGWTCLAPKDSSPAPFGADFAAAQEYFNTAKKSAMVWRHLGECTNQSLIVHLLDRVRELQGAKNA